MFPDLTSDDIFRIETQRLWLRWPRASDTASITSFASLAASRADDRVDPASLSARRGGAFRHEGARRQCQRIGACSARLIQKRCASAGDWRPERDLGHGRGHRNRLYARAACLGQGLATEAVKALVDTVFSLTRADRILANARVNNVASAVFSKKPASLLLIRVSTFCPRAAACTLATGFS